MVPGRSTRCSRGETVESAAGPGEERHSFVGDGMGISTVTAARILEGQMRGESGEENWLSFERLPYVALSKTYSVNQQTADSAPTMTAIITGVKRSELPARDGPSGAGSASDGKARPDLSAVTTASPNYRQEATVPLVAETHGGGDVAIYAGGPGAHLIHGVQEQNVIFHLMIETMRLRLRKPSSAGWQRKVGVKR